MNQPLWGNKHFFVRTRKMERPLYISNCIKGGILYVKDLNFVDGRLDEQYIFKHLKMKSNIMIELMMVKNALLPYRNIITQYPSSFKRPLNLPSDLQYLSWTSRKLYLLNIRYTWEMPSYKLITNEIGRLIEKDEIREAFIVNVRLISENILAQLNFKIMHGILVCGNYLSKFVNNINRNCLFCNQEDTIIHMLFKCEAVTHIWDTIKTILGIDINVKEIILGFRSNNNDQLDINTCITLVKFAIYKFELKCFSNQAIKNVQHLEFYMATEIANHISIDEHITKFKGSCLIIKEIVHVLMSNRNND